MRRRVARTAESSISPVPGVSVEHRPTMQHATLALCCSAVLKKAAIVERPDHIASAQGLNIFQPDADSASLLTQPGLCEQWQGVHCPDTAHQLASAFVCFVLLPGAQAVVHQCFAICSVAAAGADDSDRALAAYLAA